MKKLLICIFLLLTACGSGSNPRELFERAEFKVLQGKESQAIALYQEVVDKYPDSRQAPLAKKRLQDLQGTQ